MPRLEPADLDCTADGTPASPRYGDVYHSADSGPGQARHVFLAGNGLPERWSGRDAFAILELGFGLGVNFLATWQAWRDDANRPRRLHYVAIDKHPPRAGDLAAILTRYGFGTLATELVSRFPPALSGTHLRTFDDGRVALTLVFDDVATALRRLDARVDAVYLDGFAPSRNPEMWDERTMRGVARLARSGATCATWSAARAVRDALGAAGFAVDRRDGFGAKRDMLAGRYEPRVSAASASPRNGERHAIVVGAGLAGTSAAAALASRGWRITLVDAAPAPAAGASSLHAGTFHPLVARDDSLLARLTRAAFLHALDAWPALERRGHPLSWSRCGVLQLARRDGPGTDAADWPASYVDAVDARDAASRCGLPVERGGLWFPDAGWIRGPSLVRAWLAEAMREPSSRFLASRAVASLDVDPEGWRALDEHGATIAAAPTVVLANAGDVARLAPLGTSIASVRGQASYLPEASLDAPRAVVIGHGYVLPPVDGIVVAGSSYEPGSASLGETVAEHEGNLTRLRALAPGMRIDADAAMLRGGVGIRAVVADRMPLCGALPDLADRERRGDAVATRPGLYAIGAFGSRGLTWASLAGAILAAQVDGGPLPIETDLAAAIDPCRFVRRARRRRGG